jgi:exodeoxyribonuclease VII small subunit
VTRKPRQPDFEKSLNDLEQLVEKLEKGDLPLEDALQTFERGVALTRECQQALQRAQSRVEILLERNGRQETAPFDAPDSGAANEEEPEDA